MDYKFLQQVKVISTHDLSTTINEILAEKVYKKPFIVLEKFLVDSPIINKLTTGLTAQDIDFFIYDEIKPNPLVSSIDEGAQVFNDNHCDAVIAIGGGSIIDAGRGINIVRTLGGSVVDYVYDKTIDQFIEGLISVPTTSGTGSELSNALVVTDNDNHEKLAVLADNAVSEFAILHPELTLTVPLQTTIATGLDTFSHALESYTSNISSPITDVICEKVMYLIVKYLPKVIANGQDLEARERVMVAAAMGGWTMNSAGTHIGHSQAHVLGTQFNIPHGAACAYATPGTIRLTAPAAPKKIREVGHILGAEIPLDATDYELGVVVADQYKHFRDDVLGLVEFSTYDIARDDINAQAKSVANERFAGNTPFPVTTEVAKQILQYFG